MDFGLIVFGRGTHSLLTTLAVYDANIRQERLDGVFRGEATLPSGLQSRVRWRLVVLCTRASLCV